MAYADVDFYSKVVQSAVIPESELPKYLEAASDELDSITFNRLMNGFPTIEAHALKVKKAVCAIADALYLIDRHNQAVMPQKAEDGRYRGNISSISSGQETISYAAMNAAASVYGAAATNCATKNALLSDIAAKYVANIPDALGVNLLYGGF